MEFIQLWVNTPASAKMDGASYQPFTREEAGEVQFEGGHGVIYSGELNGIAGPVQTHTNVVVARIDVEEGGKVAFDLPGELISCIYVVSGSINVGEERVDMHNLIELEEGPETIELLGNEASELLLMAGEPLKEPMVNYGPFVMNSNQELSEAVLDYQAGKMGTLEEKFD